MLQINSYLGSGDKPVVDRVVAEVEYSVAAVEDLAVEAKAHYLVEQLQEGHD